ncbi:exosortase N [Chryseolinea lacunae]|uniref:Exosortase N n=1 Tax=Chryseolinea lacunae TaxID=2801331 RepID=A0ABS1KW79_9BACT|nr:exosortase N [Chryseolinea lacunae]
MNINLVSIGVESWRSGVHRHHLFFMVLLAAGVVGASVALPLSYVSVSNFLVGLVLLPFVIFRQGAPRVNAVYVLALLCCGVLAYRYQLKIFYFLALAFYCIVLYEALLGRLNTLVLFQVVLMSPVFLQVATILGFPIRLQLSEWAGSVLSLAGLDIAVEGNVMMLNGFTFAVDEACMGLNMLTISMLMGVFAITHHYRTQRRTLRLGPLLLFFSAVFLLNVVSNLFRIILLVLFKILPDNVLHEGTGVLCLCAYVMVPLYFLARIMVHRFGHSCNVPRHSSIQNRGTTVFLAVLGATVLCLGLGMRPEGGELSVRHATVHYKNLKPENLNGGITKLADVGLLLYVKPIPEFFTGEHTPLLCWKGSGYQFKGIRKSIVGGHEIYRGTLAKDGAMLYTAWWYTNGAVQTIDQLTWRMEMLKGNAAFCLVNVTSEKEEVLVKNLQDILEKEMLVIEN